MDLTTNAQRLEQVSKIKSIGGNWAAEARMRTGALTDADMDLIDEAQELYTANVDAEGGTAFTRRSNYVDMTNKTTGQT